LKSDTYHTGLVIGRFQPFHNGHLSIVQKAVNSCQWVIIAIGSSQESRTKRNPFTFEERAKMIYEATEHMKGIIILPIDDINDPPNWAKHVENEVGDFDVAFITSETDKALFKDAGYKVIDPGMEDRDELQGENIRNLIAKEDTTWRALVPFSVQLVIAEIDGKKIIKDTQKNG
jgi:nicotinamide-nucleotide adenylyltransferase